MTSILDRPAAPVVAEKVLTVVDNPQYAWENSNQACLAELPDDFVIDFRRQLDAVAIAAMPPLLAAAWQSRRCKVRFGTWREVATPNRAVSDKTYWDVWDHAAKALKAKQLVEDAGLNDELVGYMEAERERDDY